jgi:hypothetical protein
MEETKAYLSEDLSLLTSKDCRKLQVTTKVNLSEYSNMLDLLNYKKTQEVYEVYSLGY